MTVRLLDIARAALHEAIHPGPGPEQAVARSGSGSTVTDPAIVYVTLWHGGEVRAEGASHYLPLEEGVSYAVQCALDVPVNGRLLRLSEIPSVAIELDVRTQVRPVSSEEEHAQWLQLGNHGVSLLFDGGWFDLPPREAMRTDSDVRARRNALIARASLSGKEVTTPAWHVSEWQQWVSHDDGCHRVRAGRVQAPWRPGVANCRAAATLAAKRLLHEQDATGKYTYEYLPIEDRSSNDDYSLVRLAGTTFSMSLIASTMQDPARRLYEESAQRALGYLFRHASPTRHTLGGIFIANDRFGTERFEGKLGASALTLLALQFGPFRERYAREREGLLRAIVALQHSDGSFACNMPGPFGAVPSDHRRKSCQNYFPGEALLALAYELKAGFQTLAGETMVRAFPYYRDHFAAAPHTAFVLWQVSAWVLFHDLMRSEPRLAALCQARGLAAEAIATMVFAQADFIIAHQHTSDTTVHEAHVGGFPNTGTPGSVSSCYLEAVIRAAQLAHALGDKERFARYQESALRGLEFLHRLQIKSSEAYRFARPERAVGGIAGNLHTIKLRNDRDQHAITAFLAAADTPFLF